MTRHSEPEQQPTLDGMEAWQLPSSISSKFPSSQTKAWQLAPSPLEGAKLPSLSEPSLATTQPIAKLDDILDDLTIIRARINAGMRYLYAATDDARRSANGEHRLVRLFTDEYLPLIEQARRHGTDELTARRDAVAARLARGWAIPGQAADDLFDELLATYEALCDALEPDCLSPLLERIERVTA